MNANTIKAINKRIQTGETRFFIGAYYYELNANGIFRRREQRVGYTPTSDWELIGHWNGRWDDDCIAYC